jgi:hypothetical protein
MAVTLTTADLKQPVGEFTASLFPGDDIDALLTGWLVQATTLVNANTAIASTNHNAAAAAWCYHRGYGHIANRLASSPVRVAASLDGSMAKEMAADQRKYFIELAAKKKAEYEGYETPTAAVSVFFGRARAKI